MAFGQMNAFPFAGVPLAKRPPKRPPPAFIVFYRRVFLTSASKTSDIMSVSKEAGVAWHKLSELEKKVCRIIYNLCYVPTDHH